MSETYVIETENLTKEYKRWFHRGTCALQNLSIQVPRGSIFGFLGPNGAGKTTTIKIVMDLIKATSGTAKIMGKPSANVKIKEKVGFLPDSPAFCPQLTANEFLSICAKLFHLEGAERRRRIHEVLSEVKMEDHAHDRLGSFSRGMLQRIGVAQAILNRPELLILDEPLLGLDPYGRQEFKNIILSQQKKGTTVFFSSHILSDIEEICDRIAILKKGHLICNGRLEDLLARTGLKLTVPPDLDNVFREIVPEALEVSRGREGDRVLTFESGAEIERRLKELVEQYPGRLQIRAGHERLEDFFFRSLDKANGGCNDAPKQKE